MQYTLLIDTNDQKGLIYKVTKILYGNGLNILSQQEFVDAESRRFFFRSELSGIANTDILESELNRTLKNANIHLTKKETKHIVIMATKEAHALGDLLIKHYSGDLDIAISAVVSNRESLRDLSEKFSIPFIYVPSDNLEREEHEQRIIEVIKKYRCDYIILAKYMRILTPYFVEHFPNKIINIHHSFLPAFIGANPYKQAHERGVKIIGATSHFVNNDLDEGPIIEQETLHVGHDLSWQEMRDRGRDVEKVVLSRAVKLVTEERVFVNENKTVIL